MTAILTPRIEENSETDSLESFLESLATSIDVQRVKLNHRYHVPGTHPSRPATMNREAAMGVIRDTKEAVKTGLYLGKDDPTVRVSYSNSFGKTVAEITFYNPEDQPFETINLTFKGRI